MTFLVKVLKGCGMESFTADELMEARRAVLEPLFHEPPLGPIPSWLATHELVYGCVAEYEDKVEELDRWKVQQLNRLLQECMGGPCHVEGSLYELHSEGGGEAAFGRFRLRRMEDLTM